MTNLCGFKFRLPTISSATVPTVSENCYRIGVLLKEIFPGENIFLSRPDSKWDHYYYKLSTGEIINNYNDGKYLYLK